MAKRVPFLIIAVFLVSAITSYAAALTAEEVLEEAHYLAFVFSDSTRLPVPAGATVNDFRAIDIDNNAQSGFLINSQGEYYLLTAAHLLPQGNNVIRIGVRFNDGADDLVLFELVGYDRRYDTVVLRPASDDFVFEGQIAEIGDSSTLTRGQYLISLGVPGGFGFPFRAIKGTVQETDFAVSVSGNANTLDTFRHDSPIQHGNSGGPVLNAAGQVVGMNVVARFPERSSPNGLPGPWPTAEYGLAIPINDILDILPELIAGRAQD